MSPSLYVAILLLVGLVGGKLAAKFNLPTVTGYILFGIILGPSATNIFSREIIKSFQFINSLALSILALSIGLELHRQAIQKYGKPLFKVSLGYELLTFALVFAVVYALGTPLELSLILGTLAMTVSPSGVFAVLKEYSIKGEFSRHVLTLVAIDNLICIILFGIVTAFLQGLANIDTGGAGLFLTLATNLFITVALGAATGSILAYAIKFRVNNETFIVLLLAMVLLNSGLADYFGLSAILANMVAGAMAVNISERKYVITSTLERFEGPVLVLFLTLAGAKLNLALIPVFGLVGLGYILARFTGKVLGSYLFSGLTNMDMKYRKNIGLALTPQAGVAIGLSIIAEQKFPESGGLITGVILTGVIFFEIVGPLLVRQALKNTEVAPGELLKGGPQAQG